MSTATFDKLVYLETLKAGGVPEEQARVHAHALDAAMHEAVATKADVEMVRLEIANAKNELLRWVVPLFLAQIGLLIGVMLKLN
ncbi:MAG: hypothetical protein H7840_10025 [Alphaproteobacteria bacterium]